MPLTIVLEWVGGHFPKTPLDRVLYLGLFLSLFWLTDLAPMRPLLTGMFRRVCGVLLLALGTLLALVALRWLLLPHVLSLAPFVPPPWLAEPHHALLLPLVAAWPLALGHALLREPRTSARAYEQLGLFLALGLMLHLVTRVRVQALPVLPAIAATPYVLGAVIALLVGLTLSYRGPFALRLALLLGAGFALRTLGLYTWEVDPRVRDMLALVMSAQERFAAGENPYALYAMQHGSELPLTYLPGLWLGYGVPRLFGFDLRFMGPLMELAAFALFARIARRVEGERRAWAEAFIMCFASVWLFSPSVQWNVIYAEPALWWGLSAITLGLAFSGRFGPAAIALGLAVATRHFAVVLAPFVLVYFVRTRGLRGALPYVVTAGAVALALIAPFALADSELFWFGTLRWLREYGPAHLPWFFDRFGFVLFFYERGALDQLPLVQWGVVAGCLLAACFVRRGFIPALAATALLAFILLNVLLWDSFLLDGAICALAVIVTRPLLGEAAVAEPASARSLRLHWALLAVITALAGYLGFTLVRSMRPRGIAAAHDLLVSEVGPGDHVIDRSDRRIAFVPGRWLLRREEVPAPIGGALFDGAWGGGPALHARRAWLITEESRDAELRAGFARLGENHRERAFGDLRLQVVEPHALRLLPLSGGASVRRCWMGPWQADTIATEVSRDHPARVTLAPADLGAGLLLAAGFPNDQVVWPREAVELALRSEERVLGQLKVENLLGVQWRGLDSGAAEGEPRSLTIELRTDDPAPRTVCLQVLALDAR